MTKPSWADGETLIATAHAIGPARPDAAAGPRRLVARLDLADDRSFLAPAHLDLVDPGTAVPVHAGRPAGHGWLRIAVGDVPVELHVVATDLPAGVDLMLGIRAVELLKAAEGPVPDNVVDLGTARTFKDEPEA